MSFLYNRKVFFIWKDESGNYERNKKSENDRKANTHKKLDLL